MEGHYLQTIKILLIDASYKKPWTKKKYNYQILGINGRLDTIQASFLLNKLTEFDTDKIFKANYYLKNLNINNVNFLKTRKVTLIFIHSLII